MGLRHVALLVVLVAVVAHAAAGIGVDFARSAPRGVSIQHSGVWIAAGQATFHNGQASRMSIRFRIPARTRVAQWILRVTDRGAQQGAGEVYVRPILSVNGQVIASETRLGTAYGSRAFRVGSLLRGGANEITIALGGDSRSQYQVREIYVGPP